MARNPRLLDNESGMVEITSRTIQGRYLMRPSAQVNEIILGVLGRAQRKFGVEVFAFIFMSNHFHLLMRSASAKRMAEFVGYLKSNIAREIGRLHDWKGTFWDARYHSAPVDEEDWERVLSSRFWYLLSNGCKEGLVASPLEWPGASSTPALYRGETELMGTWYDRTAECEARGGERQSFPSRGIVRLSPLPFLAGLSHDDRRRYVVDAVHAIERETRERQRRNGKRPVGARKIERLHPHDRPEEFRPSPGPWFHCVSRERYRELRSARLERIAAYRAAADRLRAGEKDVDFPAGFFPPPRPFVEARGSP